MKEEDKDLNYWKENAKDAYMITPICVVRYITELEKAVKNNCDLPVISGWAYIRKHLSPILIGLATGITLMTVFTFIENIALKIALIIHG